MARQRATFLAPRPGRRSLPIAYAIDPPSQCGRPERVIDSGWSGILGHDGHTTYDRFRDAIRQSCVAHVLRRAATCVVGGAVRFPDQVIVLFTEAVHLRNEHLCGRVTLKAL